MTSVSKRADKHANSYEAESNVGKHLPTCNTGMVPAGDIVEAGWSQLVPINEWHWLLGEEYGVFVDQQRGYP